MIAGPAVLLLSPGPANAILTFNIFESGSDVVVQASGSLALPTPTLGTTICGLGENGDIQGSTASIFSGPCSSTPNMNRFALSSGPSSFPAGTTTGGTVSGLKILLQGQTSEFGMDTTYTNGSPIASGITFSNTTLAAMGFTSTGLIGTWQITGATGADGQINVVVGNVPGPLPLFGAAAAFAYSRRLRRRISTTSTSSST